MHGVQGYISIAGGRQNRLQAGDVNQTQLNLPIKPAVAVCVIGAYFQFLNISKFKPDSGSYRISAGIGGGQDEAILLAFGLSTAIGIITSRQRVGGIGLQGICDFSHKHVGICNALVIGSSPDIILGTCSKADSVVGHCHFSSIKKWIGCGNGCSQSAAGKFNIQRSVDQGLFQVIEPLD